MILIDGHGNGFRNGQTKYQVTQGFLWLIHLCLPDRDSKSTVSISPEAMRRWQSIYNYQN